MQDDALPNSNCRKNIRAYDYRLLPTHYQELMNILDENVMRNQSNAHVFPICTPVFSTDNLCYVSAIRY